MSDPCRSSSFTIAALPLAPCSCSQHHRLSLRNSPLRSNTTFPNPPATAPRAAQDLACGLQEAPPPPEYHRTSSPSSQALVFPPKPILSRPQASPVRRR